MPDESKPQIWLVSACLLGFHCRYNGEDSQKPVVKHLSDIEKAEIIPICPESAGGLDTPRDPAKIHGRDGQAVLDGEAQVVTSHGRDVTAEFILGAEHALRAASVHGATHACLKARSPSCGCGQIHTKEGLRSGDGVTAAALRKRGLTILSDEDLAQVGHRDQ